MSGAEAMQHPIHLDRQNPPKDELVRNIREILQMNLRHSSEQTDDLLCYPGPRKRFRLMFGAEVLSFPEQATGRRKPNIDYFSSLPDELIINIFRYLNKADLYKVMGVSRRLNRIARDSDLWRHIDFLGARLDEDDIVRRLHKNSTLLRLANCITQRRPFNSSLLVPGALQLQYLDLTNASISSDLLTALLSKCSELRKLSLENQQVTDEMSCYIGHNVKLDTLNLCMSGGLSPFGILTIVQNCQNLVSLNVAWTPMDATCMHNLTGSLSRKMKYLSLAGVKELGQEHIDQICKICPRLVHLDLSDVPVINSWSLDCIIDHLRHLQQLDISRCFQLQIGDLASMTQLPNLRYLSYFGVPRDHYLLALRQRLPHVQINTKLVSTIARSIVTVCHSRRVWDIELDLLNM